MIKNIYIKKNKMNLSFTTIILIIIVPLLTYFFNYLKKIFIYIIKSLNKKYISIKKKRLEDYFDFGNLLENIKD